ncbi:MAG: hypothetical protein ABJA82_01180 [Myxococcales bacterium]
MTADASSAATTGRASPPRVALATSRDWPDLAPDDAVLAPALRRVGIDSEIAVWTDPTVAWERFDLILIRSCWDYHDDLPRWLRWIDALQQRGLGSRLCNPPEVLRWNARKTYLAELQQLGIPTIPTRWVDAAGLASEESLRAALAASPWEEIVCKPAVSAGALGTFRFQRSRLMSAPTAFLETYPHLVQRAPLLVQPFVPEIASKGEWSLLFFSGRFSHAVLKRPTAGDFRVQEKHGGTTIRARPSAEVKALALSALGAAARAIGGEKAEPFLYARVDLVESAAGPLLVELELIEPALFLTALPPPSGGTASPGKNDDNNTDDRDGYRAEDNLVAAIVDRLKR